MLLRCRYQRFVVDGCHFSTLKTNVKHYFSFLQLFMECAKLLTMKNTDEIIEALGGTGAVAEIAGITPGAVSQWRTNGIPRGWMKYFKIRNPELFDIDIAKTPLCP